jgi:hypothetical protein
MNEKRGIRASMELLDYMTGKAELENCKVLGKPTRKKNQYEAKEQKNLFDWCKLQEKVYPDLQLLLAIPNGGSRNLIEASNLKKQGVKAGVPDMLLPVPRRGYNGLFIELKADKGKLSENQKWWLEKLNERGYKAIVCYGFENARQTILEYLKEI